MRTILECYKIVLDDLKKESYFYWICNKIEYNFHLTDEEKERLLAHFKLMKPSENNYHEFFNDSKFKKRSSEWWARKDKESRVKFLEAIIKKLENDLEVSN